MNKEVSTDAQAVYYSALASLDELSSRDKFLVVINWVKYLVLNRSIEVTLDEHASLYPAFDYLCKDFARQVTGLPEQFADILDDRPCGTCEACRATGIKPRAERVIDPKDLQ